MRGKRCSRRTRHALDLETLRTSRRPRPACAGLRFRPRPPRDQPPKQHTRVPIAADQTPSPHLRYPPGAHRTGRRIMTRNTTPEQMTRRGTGARGCDGATMRRPGRRGRVVRQRPAKPRTAVRIRSSPFVGFEPALGATDLYRGTSRPWFLVARVLAGRSYWRGAKKLARASDEAGSGRPSYVANTREVAGAWRLRRSPPARRERLGNWAMLVRAHSTGRAPDVCTLTVT